MSQITPQETKKETPIEQSLRSENIILHRQLDAEKKKSEKASDLQREVDDLKQQLSVALYEEARLKGQVESLQAPDKTHEVKIALKTKSADIEKWLAEGWINLHMEFSVQGELRTVWKREHTQQPDTPEDEDSAEATFDSPQDEKSESPEKLPSPNIEVVANEGFKPTPSVIPVPEPVNAVGKKMIIHVDSPIPQPDAFPVTKAIFEHGADKVLAGMDAMLEDVLVNILEDGDDHQPEQFKSTLLEATL